MTRSCAKRQGAKEKSARLWRAERRGESNFSDIQAASVNTRKDESGLVMHNVSTGKST